MENLNKTAINAVVYIWTKKRIQVILISCLFVLIGVVFLFFNNTANPIWLIVDPVLGIVTPLIAFFVWYNDNVREWQRTLPQKLTVHFIYKGKYIMSCINAPLIGEHDVRAFGQSIGGQMSELRNNLPLETFFDHAYIPQSSGRYDEIFNLHEISFYVQNEDEISDENIKRKIQQIGNEYRVWFDNNNINGKSEKLTPIQPPPVKPLTEGEIYEIWFKLQENKTEHASS